MMTSHAANLLYKMLVRHKSDNTVECSYAEISKEIGCTYLEAIKAANMLVSTNPGITSEAIESLGNGDYVMRYTIK